MDEAMDYLTSIHAVEEAYEVRFFDVWITGSQIRVELHDHGPTSGSGRFSATAYVLDMPDHDREVNTRGLTVGNPDSSVHGALMNLHWNVFTSELS